MLGAVGLHGSVPTSCSIKSFSAAVYGIDANIIEVEVDVSSIKMPEDHFHTVGLSDAAVRESRDRVRSALRNCGYDIPPTHITVNLAPADIRKEGSGFDLPMALGILCACGGLNKKELLDSVFVGELSLDGGTQQGLRARAHDRILEVARTIADFEAVPAIEPKHTSPRPSSTGQWSGLPGRRVSDSFCPRWRISPRRTSAVGGQS